MPSSQREDGLNSELENSWRRTKRAATFAQGFSPKIAATVGLSVLVAAITAGEPLLMRSIVDGLWQRSGGKTLALGVLGLAGLIVTREALKAFGNWLGWQVRLGVHRNILNATVGRLHSLPVSYHQNGSVGTTLTRLDRGVQGMVAAFAEITFSLFPSLIYLGISAFMMARLHGAMTAAVLIVLPLPAVIGIWAAPRQARRDRELMDRWGKIYGRFNEVLGGIVTVKSFAMEQEEKQRFMRDVDGANRLVARGVGFDARIAFTQELCNGTARLLVLGYGGYLALTGALSVGTLLAFMGYLGGLLGPVQGLTGIYQILRRASVAVGTVFSILEAEDKVPDAHNATEASALRGEVVFDGVGFGYSAAKPVLGDIHLRVSPGEMVALVGQSGGGKTTLMSLLQRLHDPDQGTIQIDGVDIRTFSQRSLRKQIGVVLQDALLFDDTVGANIAYGRPDALPSEIEAAARAANAHDFIEGLPCGYDTYVGERGSLLSAGQRQRIAIARALLKNPPIVILDEATSALDAESEAAVQEALERLLVGRTTFVVAHRLSTIIRADRIVVLHGGRVAETGTHAELMRQRGYYAQLVKLQTRGLQLAAAA